MNFLKNDFSQILYFQDKMEDSILGVIVIVVFITPILLSLCISYTYYWYKYEKWLREGDFTNIYFSRPTVWRCITSELWELNLTIRDNGFFSGFARYHNGRVCYVDGKYNPHNGRMILEYGSNVGTSTVHLERIVIKRENRVYTLTFLRTEDIYSLVQ